jgi:CRISPR/Cas system-associated endonuclease Cas1
MMTLLIELPVTTMSEITFDTHAFVKKLKAVGFTEEQAEVFAEEQVKLIEDRLATKRDLKELEERLTYRLTLRLGSMLVVAVSIVATLVKIL